MTILCVSMLLNRASALCGHWCTLVALYNSFILAGSTSDPVCFQVTPREKFVCVDCRKGDSLRSKTTHYVARNECVHKFALEFGWNPLQTVHFRADPVLLHTRERRTKSDALSLAWFEFMWWNVFVELVNRACTCSGQLHRYGCWDKQSIKCMLHQSYHSIGILLLPRQHIHSNTRSTFNIYGHVARTKGMHVDWFSYIS